ncbi:MAG: signal peptide protein [Verrucomicrobiales bacterium]|nr:signal peptide protein [Verrucomicrobiales bacterium]
MPVLNKLPVILLFASVVAVPTGQSQEPAPAAKPLPALKEAKTRARLLHTSFSGALSVMHRDFFRKNESRVIPSESLEDVFKVMQQEWGITLRWLAADATVMNVDNKAKDEFQKAAILKITEGQKEVMAVENGMLRFAGTIILRNECLKCHVKDRQSLEDRFAALEIRVPIQSAPPPKVP